MHGLRSQATGHQYTCLATAVNKIKTETGTSIIIPPDEEKSDVIRIEGDPKGVAAAKTMLLDMAAKMVRKLTASCLASVPGSHPALHRLKYEKWSERLEDFDYVTP